MRLSLMLTGSDDVLRKCRPIRREVINQVSSAVEMKDYGTTLELLLVNVVVQDAEMLRLGTRLNRKSKDIRVDVPLSWDRMKHAKETEMRAALVDCLISAVEAAGCCLTRKEDDFDAGSLVADLRAVKRGLTGDD